MGWLWWGKKKQEKQIVKRTGLLFDSPPTDRDIGSKIYKLPTSSNFVLNEGDKVYIFCGYKWGTNFQRILYTEPQRYILHDFDGLDVLSGNVKEFTWDIPAGYNEAKQAKQFSLEERNKQRADIIKCMK